MAEDFDWSTFWNEQAEDRPLSAAASESQPIVPRPGAIRFWPFALEPVRHYPTKQFQDALLTEAILVLAGSDTDRASVVNGVGFNKEDSDFGHRMAERLRTGETWDSMNAWNRYRTYGMLQKYRNTQLLPNGIDLDLVEPPKKPEKEEPIRQVGLDPEQRDAFRVTFRHLEGAEYTTVRDSFYTIVGRMWLNGNEVRVSGDQAGARSLRRWIEAHPDFEVDDLVHEKFEELLDRGEKMVRWSQAVEPPTGWALREGFGTEAAKLRPFQEAGVYYIEQATKRMREFRDGRGHGVLIADEMGLGKTWTSLAAAHHLDEFPMLVLCPNAAKLTWKRICEETLPNHKVRVVSGTYGQAISGDIVIVNYDILRGKIEEYREFDSNEHIWKTRYRFEGNDLYELLIMRDWNTVVCDEAHYLKSPDAMRTAAAQGIITETNPALRMFTTGTPVLNRADEFTTQLEMLNLLVEFGGSYRFTRDARMNPQDLNERLRERAYLRRDKRTVLPQLPAKQRDIVPMDLNNWPEYTKVQTQFQQWVREQMDERGWDLDKVVRLMRAQILAQLEYLKQAAAHGKMLDVIQWTREWLEESEDKIIIFAWHRDIQRRLANEFPGCAAIYGEDSIEDRKRNEDRFQNDPDCRVCIASIKAGGIAITLTAAKTCAFVELPWTPADVDQCEDRAYGRTNDPHGLNSHMLLVPKTIDEWMARLIDAKRKIVDALTTGEEVDDSKLLANMIQEILAA